MLEVIPVALLQENGKSVMNYKLSNYSTILATILGIGFIELILYYYEASKRISIGKHHALFQGEAHGIAFYG